MELNHEIIKKAYEAFNAIDIDKVLSFMHPQVKWPNGWEGGFVYGHNAVREYWTRQWKELDPIVVPVSINEQNNEQAEVEVHQLVKDLKGNILADEIVKHIYFFEKGYITAMEIEAF